MFTYGILARLRVDDITPDVDAQLLKGLFVSIASLYELLVTSVRLVPFSGK